MKLITNRTSITDARKLQEVISSQDSYAGKLPKYLEPLRAIISNFSDERSYGSSCFVYLKKGLSVWGDSGLGTVAGNNQKEIMGEFKSVDVI